MRIFKAQASGSGDSRCPGSPPYVSIEGASWSSELYRGFRANQRFRRLDERMHFRGRKRHVAPDKLNWILTRGLVLEKDLLASRARAIAQNECPDLISDIKRSRERTSSWEITEAEPPRRSTST